MIQPTANAVEAYLKHLQKEFAQGDATEHTHRPALKTLIESAAIGIAATNEPKAVERENKPDYIVHKGSSIIGFVEAKDIGRDLKVALKTPQLKRYLEALPNLIVTNYVDFIWFAHGVERMAVSLGTFNGKVIAASKDAEHKWAKLVESFLAEKAPTLTSPSQLAKSLAGQTRLLRDLANELLVAKDADLLSQNESFRTLLVPDLKPEEFADMYAQTAAYGLFTARVFEHTTVFSGVVEPLPDSMKGEPFSLEKAAYLIPKENPFLRQFFQHIASPNLSAQLRWLVEQIAESLHYVDMDKILRRQSRKQGFEDPVFHFYETFLAEYDRSLRESRGVYYTPEPVVDFIVRSVDELLKSRFDKPRGLADPSALVLDPATGTATFLRKVIDLVHERVVKIEKQGGNWDGYVRTHLLPRLFGFELMMAPYTVAHLKLALQLQQQGFSFAPGERLHVYLTNTLDQLHNKTAAMLGQWIAAENEGAEQVKLHRPVEVVLGNPPYSGISRNNGKWIEGLVGLYKTEPEGGPLQERKHWLNDDYVKFIRFAHDRIARTGHGIVAVITNHGWLDNPTFRGMRARLMEDFDEIYVLDLHGNSKKKERTPTTSIAFGDDKNVFDIEQGVSIAFLIKLAGEKPTPKSADGADDFELTAPSAGAKTKTNTKLAGGKVTLRANVFHAELWGNRDHKYAWLENHSHATTPWTKLQPSVPLLLLVPRDDTGLTEYDKGWKVTDIFPTNTSGIVTARDGLVFDFDEKSLIQKIERFVDPAKTDEEIRSTFFGGRKADKYPSGDTRGWKLPLARNILQATEWKQSIIQCLYRPFDSRALLYTKGMIDWGRWNLMIALDGKFARDNLALVTSRMTKGEDFAHALLTDTPVEVICLSPKTSNNGFVFPLWVPDKDGITRLLNIAPTFSAALAQALGRTTVRPYDLPDQTLAADILAYVYAVLHAPSFRRCYSEFLKSDFPRIPISLHANATDDTTFADVWSKLVPLGHELIDLHLLRKVPSALLASFPVSGSLPVEKPRYELPNTPMNPGSSGRVYINMTQYFDDVEPETWTFTVGGYQVCEKWLKDRKGRTLSFDDTTHYSKIVAALTRTRALMREIDAVADGTLWPKAH